MKPNFKPVDVKLDPQGNGRFHIIDKTTGEKLGEAQEGIKGFEALKAMLKTNFNYVVQ